MQQLDQRVARRCELHPLSEAEVKDYIERRLMVAAQSRTVAPAGDKSVGAAAEPPADLVQAGEHVGIVQFTPAAFSAAAAVSKGIPRLVNTLCDRALEIGFENRARVIDDAVIVAAADRLKLKVPARAKMPGNRIMAAAAAVLLVFGGLIAWWMVSGAPPESGAPSTAAQAGSALPGTTASNAPAGVPGGGAPAAAASSPATPAPASVQGRPTPVAPVQTPPAVPAVAAAPPPRDATPAPAPRAASPASRYSIAVAAFRTPQRAAQVAAELQGIGLRVATQTDAAGWHQTIVGPFPTLAQAQAAQETLTNEGYRDTRIFQRAPPAR
jgi:hypothetical protein